MSSTDPALLAWLDPDDAWDGLAGVVRVVAERHLPARAGAGAAGAGAGAASAGAPRRGRALAGGGPGGAASIGRYLARRSRGMAAGQAAGSTLLWPRIAAGRHADPPRSAPHAALARAPGSLRRHAGGPPRIGQDPLGRASLDVLDAEGIVWLRDNVESIGGADPGSAAWGGRRHGGGTGLAG